MLSFVGEKVCVVVVVVFVVVVVVVIVLFCFPGFLTRLKLCYTYWELTLNFMIHVFRLVFF